jgi:DNA mismatch repair protein MutL
LGRIRVLSDVLINRIAAGEVVERPASAVKELVENALDSGARSVDVRLRGGGKQWIRVADDGAGMDRDDAVLALERHATSKLTENSDLEAIETLGFRGEALASIAAVSRLLLRTAVEDGAGTEVEVRAGRIVAVREAGLPRGTAVEVERLFFNVPARRKFLKADATELSHVTRLVTQFALAYPGVRFRLEQQGRRLLQADPVGELKERIAQIYGRAFLDKLLPFRREARGLIVHGLAGRPADAGSRRDGQHFFVNGRLVQDRLLGHAVTQAYGNTVPKGRFPAVFLFLELATGLVDVNVHPRKTEVRFRFPGPAHDQTRDALTEALSHEAVIPELADLRPGAARTPDPSALAAATLRYLETSEPGATAWRAPFATGPTGAAGPAGGDLLEPDGERPACGVVPLAQFRDSYIVAQDADGLIVVDQHAAHERVLFERYLREAEENRVEVQKLLFPVTFDLPPHEFLLVEEEADEFRRLGFIVEPFGGRTVRLDGIPAVAADSDPAELLRELLGEAARARSATADLPALRRRLVTTAACRAAVKVHDPLNRESMQQLLDDLFSTVSPSTCPHGRPLLFRLSLEEIERAFGRR